MLRISKGSWQHGDLALKVGLTGQPCQPGEQPRPALCLVACPELRL